MLSEHSLLFPLIYVPELAIIFFGLEAGETKFHRKNFYDYNYLDRGLSLCFYRAALNQNVQPCPPYVPLRPSVRRKNNSMEIQLQTIEKVEEPPWKRSTTTYPHVP